MAAVNKRKPRKISSESQANAFAKAVKNVARKINKLSEFNY